MNTSTENKWLIPLAGMSLDKLKEVAKELELPSFRAGQIAKWIYTKRVTDIDEMTDLSKGNRERLKEHYCVGLEAPTESACSTDGTVKYLFTTNDGNAIESVFIPDKERATLCISSQKGCKMNCTFCMTGRQGFRGNLTANQIINQILSVPNAEDLTNVVFMGMGEPMDNLDAVIETLEIMTADWGLAWSPKRITVSTIGKIPELKRLIETTDVHIAISIHSPFHEERLAIMPVENAYPAKDVMELLKKYDFSHQRRLSIEYIMWDGFNDDIVHAEALSKLLRAPKLRVNLIRFHSIPGSKLRASSTERMESFRDFLSGRGLLSTIRRSRGEDIMAACGMLAGKKNVK
ncbi:MAG: 23S rRNA (adenine(2503)-C(2))-methyltransferase RlmN [Muribaculaceae bacterium]